MTLLVWGFRSRFRQPVEPIKERILNIDILCSDSRIRCAIENLKLNTLIPFLPRSGKKKQKQNVQSNNTFKTI